jgi:hypothetical protein
MGGTSRDSGVDIVAVPTVGGVDRAARQFPRVADGDSGLLWHRARVTEHYSKRVWPSRGPAGKLLDYFQALNSGDQARWGRAFDDTWHPEGILDGRSAAALRDRHRQWQVAGRIHNIHIVRDIDAHRVEFTTECGWKREGPFVATFRDGRIYRLL